MSVFSNNQKNISPVDQKECVNNFDLNFIIFLYKNNNDVSYS